MNFCTDPHSLVSIDLNELIGKSLNTINTNFSLLQNQTCKESVFLSNFSSLYSNIETKIDSLGSILKGSPIAYVIFDNSGNILNQKQISSISKISLGSYRVFFSSPINDPYLISSNIISNLSTYISIVSESINSVSITIREQNGNLIDPEKISLLFFV